MTVLCLLPTVNDAYIKGCSVTVAYVRSDHTTHLLKYLNSDVNTS